MKDRWLESAAWNNARYIQGKIRAVVLSFHGLGGMYRTSGNPLEVGLAADNILVIAPFYGPWSWMNRLARKYVDEVVERTYTEFELDENLPLISSGGSMGGCSALLYCRYGKKAPAACDALYPVCNAPLHYTERPDLPSSFNYAFYGYEEPLEDILKEHSPFHQADQMPRIPYLFIHGTADTRVSRALHSEPMVAALKERGHDVTYIRVPGMGHGENVPLSVIEKRRSFISSFASEKKF